MSRVCELGEHQRVAMALAFEAEHSVAVVAAALADCLKDRLLCCVAPASQSDRFVSTGRNQAENLLEFIDALGGGALCSIAVCVLNREIELGVVDELNK